VDKGVQWSATESVLIISYEGSHRKLLPLSQFEQSSCHHSRRVPQWTQLLSNVSRHPAQALHEHTESGDIQKLSFRFILFFYFIPTEFSFFCAVSNRLCCRCYFPFFLLVVVWGVSGVSASTPFSPISCDSEKNLTASQESPWSTCILHVQKAAQRTKVAIRRQQKG
jgi:hypothetical protein